MPKLTRLQQSGFVLDTGSERIAFDIPTECPPDTVAKIKPVVAVVATHKHPDHFCPAHLTTLGAPIFAPSDALADIEDLDLPKHPIFEGQTFVIGKTKITTFRCDHGPGLSAPIENLSLLIELASRRIYVVGDMAVASPSPEGTFDVVVVPVGGSKVFTPEQALEFLLKIKHTGLVIPVHYHGRSDRESGKKFASLAENFVKPLVLDVEAELDLSSLGR